MMNGWETKKLSDLYQIGSSKRVMKSQWKTSGVPFYRGREVTQLAVDGFVDNELFISEEHFAELSEGYGVPQVGDIIITAIGTIGNSHVVRGSDRFNFKDGSVLWMKRTADVSSEFVNLWLKSGSFVDQLDRGNGAIVDTLSIQRLKSVELRLPTLHEQRRIVSLLDEAFEGIAVAKANAEKNLENACTNFESHLQSVFTYRGPGWTEAKLGEVCDFIRGSQPPKSVFSKARNRDNIRLIKIRDYKSGKHIVYIPRAQAKRFCDVDDVMIGRYGPPLFQILRGLEGAYNVALMKAVPDASKLSRDFLFYFLKHPNILQYVIYHSARAAGQSGLTKETLEPYPIALLSLNDQRRVVETNTELEFSTQRLVGIYKQKLAALDDLKNSLLHQAFTGKL
jgi:type I restriction enzyme S subunit